MKSCIEILKTLKLVQDFKLIKTCKLSNQFARTNIKIVIKCIVNECIVN